MFGSLSGLVRYGSLSGLFGMWFSRWNVPPHVLAAARCLREIRDQRDARYPRAFSADFGDVSGRPCTHSQSERDTAVRAIAACGE